MTLPQILDTPFLIKLSFYKIIEQYEAIAASGKGLAAKNARALLREVSRYPELKDGITDALQITAKEPLISQLVAELFPVSLTKNEIKAITIPYQGVIVNCTDRFQNILNDAGPGFEINIRDFTSDQFYVFSCGIILNRYYGASLDFNKPLFYDIPAANGIMKYYRILYNADFMEIFPSVKATELSPAEIRLLLDSYDDIAMWKKIFPPGSWIMKGFSIMTLIDVTVENAVSILKDNLLGKSSADDFRRNLFSVFRSIFQIKDIQAGLTLYHQETGKISTMGFGQILGSFLLPDKEEDDHRNLICDETYDTLIKKQNYFAVANIEAFSSANPGIEMVKVLKKQQVKSFIFAPVIKDKILLGFIELVSFGAGELNSVNAAKLDMVMPFLVDAIDQKITEYQNHLRAIIQSNYTSMHPSVNWKFEQEARNYIRSLSVGSDHIIKEIRFRKVFPLYGQVDIRNSSTTRNLSVKADLENQLVQLIVLIEKIATVKLINEAENHIEILKGFIIDMADKVKADTEQSVSHYLDLHIYPRLNAIEKSNTVFETGIKKYFKETDNLTGTFYANRRNYEKTLLLVNTKLLDILDTRQIEIQRYYSHYYERFKTDGVEHNLYIGSAITPDKEFNNLALLRLRLWQLLVTAEMEMAQFQLKSNLPYQLGVTTLILVFTTPIDIRFRMDEKHFDIDGAYNIRYEVIKKRIDKAVIKGTNERITHRGQLTIVYSKKDEETEYLKLLCILQTAGIVADKTEKLEVEDLQGVSGLKALRTAFLYNEKLLFRFDSLYEEMYQKLT